MLRILLILLIAAFTACNNSPQADNNTERDIRKQKNIFTAKEIGWTTEIPAGWKQFTEEEDATEFLTPLLYLRKDSSAFISYMEVYKGDEYGYEQWMGKVRENIKKDYVSRGLKAEYDMGAKRIDGIFFDIFEITVYKAGNENEVKGYSKFYTTRINGYVLSMGLKFNNNVDKEELLTIVYNSQFAQKD